MPSNINQGPSLAERLGLVDGEHRPLNEIANDLDSIRRMQRELAEHESALIAEHDEALAAENFGVKTI